MKLFNGHQTWLALFLLSSLTLRGADDSVDYQRQVAPLLKKYCAGCHNDADREGDFSVTTLEALRKGTPDGPVVVANDPKSSRLMQLVLVTGDAKMPPDGEPQPAVDEIEMLRKWIEQGAVGESTSMIPAERMSVPSLPAAPSSAHFIGAACLVDDQRLAVGRLSSVELVDTTTNISLWTTSELPGKVNSIRLSHDGKMLIVGGGMAGISGEVTLLDATSGAVLKRFQDHKDAVYCASLSPDGKWIASGSYDRQVIIWDAESGRVVHRLSGHNGAIYDLDFDPSSRVLVSSSADQTVKLWHVNSGQRLDTFGQPEGEMLCVRFSSDGKYVFAGGADRQLRKWRILSTEKPAINPLLVARFAHESDVLQLQLVGEDRLLTAARDRKIKLWDTAELRPLRELGEAADQPVALCVSADSSVIVVPLTGDIQTLSLSPALEPAAQPSPAEVASITRTASPPPEPDPPTKYDSQEPNDTLAMAAKIELPAEVIGSIDPHTATVTEDIDLYGFDAQAGETWIFEVNAARSGSKLDSQLAILDEQGRGVIRTRLQAVRESYFTFRGKDSDTMDDFRMHKWEDMELDEFLYSSGEVVKLWLYPRGPDSGFKVYPGAGKRDTYFDTTPIAHALGEPAYIVRELRPGEVALPNGLPVFPIYFENDDDAQRHMGIDSRLTFVAPADGHYFVRISDSRGFGGQDYAYTLAVRAPQPDFVPQASLKKMDIAIGTGREWSVTATRLDGLDEPISVTLIGLPDGLLATDPLIIEAGQIAGTGTIYATEDALNLIPQTIDKAVEESAVAGEKAPQKNTPQSAVYEVGMLATCVVDGRTITHELPDKLQILVSPSKGIRFQIMDAQDASQPLSELSVQPGKTTSARIVLERAENKAAISFGKEDSGRGLPHGAFVDNIGLNGLLIPAEQNEREFYITAAPKLQPGRYQFHLRIESDGSPTSRPIWLNVTPASPEGP